MVIPFGSWSLRKPDTPPELLRWLLFMKKGLLGELTMSPSLLSKSPRSMCFISSNGCFLAGTAAHVLSTESRWLFFHFVTVQSNLLPSPHSFQSFFLSAQPSLRLRQIHRNITLGQINPAVCSGHVPIPHYNYPFSFGSDRLHSASSLQPEVHYKVTM